MKVYPRPTGELQGDDRPMPSRGTGAGMNGDTYGASLGQDDTNSRGSIAGHTKSDPADECCTKNPIGKN